MAMAKDYSSNIDIFSYEISAYLRQKQIGRLFPWQYQCLKLVLSTENDVIFTAPTGSGKSLIAELAVLNRISSHTDDADQKFSIKDCHTLQDISMDKNMKAIYILPFISIAREKLIDFQTHFRSLDLVVEGFFGSCLSGSFDSCHLAICTIEKANSILNRLIEEGNLRKICTVIVDEFHYLADKSRGYALELLLTKILYHKKKLGIDIQIICMSATIPNIEFLAENWLNAKYFRTSHRSIPLYEYIYCGGKFYSFNSDMKKLKFSKELNSNLLNLPNDPEHVVGLCLETVMNLGAVLVFCSTKSWCEKLAVLIAESIETILKDDHEVKLGVNLRHLIDPERQKFFFQRYKACASCKDKVLTKTLKYAVAFHHAGLTMEEREQLEWAFENHYVKILVATSTLCSGINLPAQRVILRSPWGHQRGRLLTKTTYMQMIGRAGRSGLDKYGLSGPPPAAGFCSTVMNELGSWVSEIGPNLCKYGGVDSEIQKFWIISVMLSRLKITDTVRVNSVALELNFHGESILICKESELDHGLQLLQSTENNVKSALLSDLKYGGRVMHRAILESVASRMVNNLQDLEAYITSTLAFAELRNEKFNIRSVIMSSIDYLMKNEFLEYIDENYRPTQLGSAAMSSTLPPDEALAVLADLREAQKNLALDTDLHMLYLIHLRFFACLMLFDLISEMPLETCASRYQVNRGYLQTLQQQGANYASMIVNFCDRLGWYYLKCILSGFAERIAFGVRRELSELVAIPGLDGSRARIFHQNSLVSLTSVANCNRQKLAQVLRKAVPFQSGVEDNYHANKRPWLANYPDLTEDEAVDHIQSKAAQLLAQKMQIFIENNRIVAGKCSENFDSLNHHKKLPKRFNVQDKIPILNESALLEFENTSFSSEKDLAKDLTVEDTKNSKKVRSVDIGDFLDAGQLSQLTKDFTENLQPVDGCVDDNVEVENVTASMNTLSLADLDENFSDKTRDDQNISMIDDEELLNLIESDSLKKKSVINIDQQDTANSGFEDLTFCRTLALMYDAANPNFVSIFTEEAGQSIIKMNDFYKILIQGPTVVVYDLKSLIFALYSNEKIDITIESRDSNWFCMKTAFWMLDYCMDVDESDARVLLDIYPKLVNLLRERSLFEPFRSIECKILPLVARMELFGLNFRNLNLVYFDECSAMLTDLLTKFEKQCYSMAGGDGFTRKFCLNSHREISRLLFVDLKLPVPDNMDSKENWYHYSTNKRILQDLKSKHRLPGLISDYRRLFHAHTSCVLRLKEKFERCRARKEDFACRYDLRTSTGRMIMMEPNFQAFPKKFTVTDLQNAASTINLRKLVKARDGYTLLAADFCQIELRILAHYCQDQRLLRIFNDQNSDVFTLMASRWKKIDIDRVTVDDRQKAKQICYGIIYGIGAKSLAQQLNVTMEESETFLNDFKNNFPGINVWIRDTLSQFRVQNFVTTLAGRRRMFIQGSDHQTKADRQAINTIIQGSAADILKLSMIKIDEKFSIDNRLSAYFLLQIHDELIFEVKNEILDDVCRTIKFEMENCFQLRNLNLAVKLKLGNNWGEME